MGKILISSKPLSLLIIKEGFIVEAITIGDSDELEITAKDLMVDPHFIHMNDSIDELKDKLKTTEDTLIVLDENDEFVGEIHERDLLKLIVPEDEISEEEVVSIFGTSFGEGFVAEKAGDLVHKHDFTVKPDTKVKKLALLMYKEEIRALPVVKDDEIVGVVHLRKLINEVHRK